MAIASRSNFLSVVLIIALGLLSIAAGLPKILQMPQELGFLESIGLSAIVVSILGVIQLVGGIFLLWPSLRFIGALLAGFAFAVSSVAIFVHGDAKFGLVSLVPLLALIMVIYAQRSRERSSVEEKVSESELD